MAQIGSMVVRTLGGVLKAETGLPFAIGQIVAREEPPPGDLPFATIVEQNIAFDTLEKKAGAKYPSVHLYCDRLENKMREKFRTFSGLAYMAIEVRVSQDRLGNLERDMRRYVDAVTQVLDFNRGDWGRGVFFGGAYEVTFEPVGHGGRNYLQTAKVTFSLDVSVD